MERLQKAYSYSMGGGVMLGQTRSELIHEIMLQINERLYLKEKISRELYEQAKLKIVKAEKK